MRSDHPVESLVARLIEVVPGLANACEEERTIWNPERSPSTIILARIGRTVVEAWRSLDVEAKSALASLIEKEMCSRDQTTADAVATGLIEAMLNAASRSQDCSEKEMLDFLGPASNAYAVEWMSFYGCSAESSECSQRK